MSIASGFLCSNLISGNPGLKSDGDGKSDHPQGGGDGG